MMNWLNFRDTPTSAGPNSFGKTRKGFCDVKKVFERDLKTKMNDASQWSFHKLSRRFSCSPLFCWFKHCHADKKAWPPGYLRAFLLCQFAWRAARQTAPFLASDHVSIEKSLLPSKITFTVCVSTSKEAFSCSQVVWSVTALPNQVHSYVSANFLRRKTFLLTWVL